MEKFGFRPEKFGSPLEKFGFPRYASMAQIAKNLGYSQAFSQIDQSKPQTFDYHEDQTLDRAQL